MSRQSIDAVARASLVLLPLFGACTPAPSKTSAGVEAAEQQAKPVDTCKHVRELADKESDDAALLDRVERECVATLTTLENRYQAFSTCVAAAADGNAVYECEKGLDKPRPLLAAVGPGAKIEAVCDHVLGMITQQIDGAAQEISAAELDALREQCIQDASKQLELVGPEQFNADADCLLAAQSLEAMQSCGL